MVRRGHEHRNPVVDLALPDNRQRQADHFSRRAVYRSQRWHQDVRGGHGSTGTFSSLSLPADRSGLRPRGRESALFDGLCFDLPFGEIRARSLPRRLSAGLRRRSQHAGPDAAADDVLLSGHGGHGSAGVHLQSRPSRHDVKSLRQQ